MLIGLTHSRVIEGGIWFSYPQKGRSWGCIPFYTQKTHEASQMHVFIFWETQGLVLASHLYDAYLANKGTHTFSFSFLLQLTELTFRGTGESLKHLWLKNGSCSGLKCLGWRCYCWYQLGKGWEDLCVWYWVSSNKQQEWNCCSMTSFICLMILTSLRWLLLFRAA